MDEKLKYSLLRDSEEDVSIWTRHEKRLWFITLMMGTCMLYSTRTSMPLLLPAIASDLKWSKTESAITLSAFFWGYTVTQVLGGYFSDRIGGQRVIFLAAVGWSLITFYMPELLLLLPRTWHYTIHFIVAIRILNGACQGVHFPSMISLTSQNLNANERSSYFSLLHCGSAFGTLLTGIMGSFLLDYFGWQIAFRIIGFLGIAWALTMRYYTMSSDRNRVIHVSIPSRLCATNAKCDVDTSVPWLKLFARPCFWAMVITHACENNCFFVLLSWLPTYFHDAFPQAKGWVVNMVPWLAMPPCILIGKYMTGELLRREWSLTSTRKIVQSVCFLSQNVALFTMCHINNFYLTLICMTIVIGGSGFHNNAVMVNPQDIAPSHSGSVFGLMNTFGAIPGFLGVYLAGHILEVTQSWPAVFITAALINTFGWILFTIFGSANKIV